MVDNNMNREEKASLRSSGRPHRSKVVPAAKSISCDLHPPQGVTDGEAGREVSAGEAAAMMAGEAGAADAEATQRARGQVDTAH